MARTKMVDVIVDKNGVQFNFANDHKVAVDITQLSDEIKQQLITHGLKQKLADSMASAKGDVAFAIAQVEQVADALRAGQWKRNGGSSATGGILAEAVAKVKKISVEDARVKLAALSDDDQKKLAKAPSIEQAVLEIKLARKKAVAKTAVKDGESDPLDLI